MKGATRIGWFQILLGFFVIGLAIEYWQVSVPVIVGIIALVGWQVVREKKTKRLSLKAAAEETERKLRRALKREAAATEARERRRVQRYAMLAAANSSPGVMTTNRPTSNPVDSERDAETSFDVALSFAGEDRACVHAVAEKLKSAGVLVFYDEYFPVEMWGEDLVVYLDEVYRKRSRYVIVFVSRHYVTKPWTAHERRSAQARFLNEDGVGFLPVRLDDSELPGLPPTIAYVDMRRRNTDSLVALILEKLQLEPRPTEPAGVDHVPRTPNEEALLLATRPSGWEYMLFAAVLLRERDRLDPKWRDHALSFVRSEGKELSDEEAVELVYSALRQAKRLSGNIGRILTPETSEIAFGKKGEPGNPSQIEHLAKRLLEVYEGFLDWSASLRNALVPGRFDRAIELASSFADHPLCDIRDFVDKTVHTCDDLPALLAKPSDEVIEIKLILSLDIDDDLVKEFNREMRKLRR